MKVSRINHSNYSTNYNISKKNQNNGLKENNLNLNKIQKFNYNYPISFGWCEKHNVRSKEISIIFLNQLKKQKEKEANAAFETTRLEYLELANNANKEALNFLMQFTNRQKNEAEFIPLWSLMNNENLRSEMQQSKVFGDPVGALISLNSLQDVKIKNDKITEEQLSKAQGSLQLHTAVILINQIEQSLNDPTSLAYQDKELIQELISIVKDNLDSVYGTNIYEKVLQLSKIGSEPDFSSKKESLDTLTKIDNDAKPFLLNDKFTEKLESLIDHQKQLEYEKTEIEQEYKHKVTIGAELTVAQKDKLNSILESSSDLKERKAAEFMLKINHQIRFSKEEISHSDIHHREHILNIADHVHLNEENDVELDEVNVQYHEHSHNGHTHNH